MDTWYIADAIMRLIPGAQFSWSESLWEKSGLDSIDWKDGIKPEGLTLKKIEAEITVIKAERVFNQYRGKRKKVYPTIEDQLDMQYWDMVNGTSKWKDAISKVKSDIKKPGE